MKKNIDTLQDGLVYILEGLNYAEKKIKQQFTIRLCQIESPELKVAVRRYTANTPNTLLKMERVFGYLLQEPTERKNEVINRLLAETQHMLDHVSSQHLKDLFVVGCLQNIITYKISSYRAAYTLAAELLLDTPADLLQQILEWELAAAKSLNEIAIIEFNRYSQATMQYSN